jgi:hypothetical protein
MTDDVGASRPPPSFGVRSWFAAPLWRLVLYSLVSLPIGILGCVLMFFGVLYSVVLAPIGLILFLLPTAAARLLARSERRRARRYLGLTVAEPAPQAQTKRHLYARGVAGVRDEHARREVLHFLLAGPVGLGVTAVAAGSLFLIGRGLAELAFIPLWPAAFDDAWGGSMAGALFVHCSPGVIALIAGPWAIARATGAQGRLVHRLLGA